MTITTQNIDKHEKLLKEFENNPMFEAFQMWIEYLLRDKDIEIAGLYKKIDLCLDEIQQLKTLFKLAELEK